MNTPLFWMILGCLQLSCLWVGYKATRKQKSQHDYYLAGRTLSFFPLLMTFVATQVGGGLILGSAEEAYRVGWKIIFYPLGAISGFFLLSSGLGRRLASLPVSTVAQIFEVTYGSKRLKQIASILSMVTLFLITVAQVVASQKFMATFHLDNPVFFTLFWGIVLLYTMWGGMEGIAAIDAIQATFFLLIFGLSLGAAIYWNPSSTLLLSDRLPLVSSQIEPTTWVGWFLMPCLFMLIEQDMAQRCFSARSPGIMRRAALGSAGIIFLVSLIPIYFGLMGQVNGISVPKNSSALMLIVSQITSPAVTAAIACAVMMAIISTAVSLIHSVSSNFTQDFSLPFRKESSRLIFSKGVTLVIGVLAVAASVWFDNIVALMMQSYELSVVCLFIPILVALFKQEGSLRSAVMAMSFGAASFLWFRFFPQTLPSSVPREPLEILASGIGFALSKEGSRKSYSITKPSKTRLRPSTLV